MLVPCHARPRSLNCPLVLSDPTRTAGCHWAWVSPRTICAENWAPLEEKTHLHVTMLLTVDGRTENAFIAKAPLAINCAISTTNSFGPISRASHNSRCFVHIHSHNSCSDLGFPLDHKLPFMLIVLGGSRLPLLNSVEGATSPPAASSRVIATPQPVCLALPGTSTLEVGHL